MKKADPAKIEWEISGLGHDLLRNSAYVHLAPKKEKKWPLMVSVHLHLSPEDIKGRELEDAIRNRAREVLRSALDAV